jgi:hypothetical protein
MRGTLHGSFHCIVIAGMILPGTPLPLQARQPASLPPSPSADGHEPADSFPRKKDSIHRIGQPTPEEQFYVELINRARANPGAEGKRLAQTGDMDVQESYRFFSVDLERMKSEFASLSKKPPLAINVKLTDAARGHSRDMFKKEFQGHTGSDGSSIGERASRAGYSWKSIAENVYAFAESVWHGHAGFQVDWGEGSGGMQPGRGHRMNIHGNFREVGVGVVKGSKGDVGPQLVTQNFGSAKTSTAFVTGVAYYDLDKDGFYSPGEGIGGLSVSAKGASQRSVTANSGGYAIPIPSTSATRRVDFSGLGFSHSVNATISGGANVKVDFKPAYTPPKVSGPGNPTVGRNATYTFPAVKGATAYDWRVVRESPARNDSAEGLSRGSVDSAGGYSRLSKTAKFSGGAAYHFAHVQLNRDESFTYTPEFLPGPKAAIAFRSRLGWATKTQTAKIQASTNEGKAWVDVYSQSGSGSAGESTFQSRSANLGRFAGKPVRLRFLYTMQKGSSAFSQTSPDTGWIVDDIVFTDVGELTAPTITRAGSSRSFAFKPATAGTHHLSARPIVSGGSFPFGPMLKVVARK